MTKVLKYISAIGIGGTLFFLLRIYEQTEHVDFGNGIVFLSSIAAAGIVYCIADIIDNK